MYNNTWIQNISFLHRMEKRWESQRKQVENDTSKSEMAGKMARGLNCLLLYIRTRGKIPPETRINAE